jgi:hypothetical protein
VTGVTFAALQSQAAVLSGNTIQTASANLLIGTAGADSSEFSNSPSGFTFATIIPGGAASDSDSFFLKNTGTTTLNLKMSVGSTPTNTSDVDLTKVTVQITRVDTGKTQSASLQSLLDGYPSDGLALTDTLAPAANGVEYKLSVSMSADAFTGSSASIGSIDFVFSGTAATS